MKISKDWTPEERLRVIDQIAVNAYTKFSAQHAAGALQTIHFVVEMPAEFLNLNLKSIERDLGEPIEQD